MPSTDRPAETSPGVEPQTPSHAARNRADQQMLRATMVALLVAVLLDAAVVIAALMMADGRAVVGALLGTVLTLVVVLPTVMTAYLAPRLGAAGTAGVMFGGWGGKMLVVVITLIAVRDVQSVDLLWTGIALIAGALVAVAVETVLLARLRQPLNIPPRR